MLQYLRVTKLDPHWYGFSDPSDSLSRSTGLELVFCKFSNLVQVILLVSLGILSHEEQLRTSSRCQRPIT
jgi:hypothetical protein